MNDFWNDPPEGDEPPFCDKCQEFMDIAENWITAKCPTCGKEWAAPPQEIEIDQIQPEDIPQETTPRCPHGNEWHCCDACDIAGDLAYDAARERRFK